MKALEIKTSTVFNLFSGSNTILSGFFFFFLIIDLYFLITAVTAQISISNAKLVIPERIPTKKQKQKLKCNQ